MADHAFPGAGSPVPSPRPMPHGELFNEDPMRVGRLGAFGLRMDLEDPVLCREELILWMTHLKPP